jgi:sterol 24-C-methyltransferase
MTTAPKLATKNFEQDAAFSKALHGDASKSGWSSFVGRDKGAHAAAVDGYFKHWDNKGPKNETLEDKQERLNDYASLTRQYYNLVTDFYEYGWGQSFHFCRFYPGEPFRQAIARHEHYLAAKGEFTENMKLLDVGCGVGGPAREIHRFSGASVVGLNNNDYQIARANRKAEQEGLADKLKFVKGDFMQMDFPDASFDGVYAIEATVHAPVLEGVYGEIYRVLKPGGTFAVYEWLLSDKYDENNPRHREIVYGIEIGNGVPKMQIKSVAEDALKKVGFEIQYARDLAENDDAVPWYYPLTGEWKNIQNFSDLVTFARVSVLGRWVTMQTVGLLEKIGLAPAGTKKVTVAVEQSAVYVIEGAKEGLFTPMMLYVCKKPEN